MPHDVQPISTSVSARHRSVSVLREDGVTDRYCLMRRPNGDVHWVLDSFKPAEDGGPPLWSTHHGTLRVAEVLSRVPDAARDVVRWTERELEDGVDVLEVDLFTRDRRARSLDRLAAELGELAD